MSETSRNPTLRIADKLYDLNHRHISTDPELIDEVAADLHTLISSVSRHDGVELELAGGFYPVALYRDPFARQLRPFAMLSCENVIKIDDYQRTEPWEMVSGHFVGDAEQKTYLDIVDIGAVYRGLGGLTIKPAS